MFIGAEQPISATLGIIYQVLETDQYWGDVSYVGIVEAQGSILRSSSMWMVSLNLFLDHWSSYWVFVCTWQLGTICFKGCFSCYWKLDNVQCIPKRYLLTGLLFLATGQPPDDYTGTKFDFNDLDIWSGWQWRWWWLLISYHPVWGISGMQMCKVYVEVI